MLLIESQCFAPTTTYVLMRRYGGLLIEQHEHYQKRSYRNRIHLAGPQGVETFSIPLQSGKNAQLPITEVGISYDKDWPRQLSRRLQTCYGSAPYYEHYIDGLMEVISAEHCYLYDLNEAALSWTMERMRIDPRISHTDIFIKEYSSSDIRDYRNKLRPNSELPALPHYRQVYEDRHGYLPHLSILDLLFCLGPEASIWLTEAIVDLDF